MEESKYFSDNYLPNFSISLNGHWYALETGFSKWTSFSCCCVQFIFKREDSAFVILWFLKRKGGGRREGFNIVCIKKCTHWFLSNFVLWQAARNSSVWYQCEWPWPTFKFTFFGDSKICFAHFWQILHLGWNLVCWHNCSFAEAHSESMLRNHWEPYFSAIVIEGEYLTYVRLWNICLTFAVFGHLCTSFFQTWDDDKCDCSLQFDTSVRDQDFQSRSQG